MQQASAAPMHGLDSSPDAPWSDSNLEVMTLGFACVASVLTGPGGLDGAKAGAYHQARARLRARDVPAAIDRLSALFGLSPFDEDLLLFALSAQLHGRPKQVTPQAASTLLGIDG